jgi:hypothetical protein
MAVSEEFGHALRAVQDARVNHSESVDLAERDSDSRMELLDSISPDQIVEECTYRSRR